MRALTRAEVLQLRDEITVVLPGEVGNFHILRDTLGAVTGRALRDEIREVGIFERLGRERKSQARQKRRANSPVSAHNHPHATREE